jgi:hydrogenase nickel incorporation protein HypA/HybF
MHELSIAVSIVEMAAEQAEQRAVEISAIHLRVGALSGVVKEALLFCYPLACEGTCLEGSQLIVHDVQGSDLEVTALEVRQ